MKSTISMDQLRDLLDREARGEFGDEGIGGELQWLVDHSQTVRDLRKFEEFVSKDWIMVKDVAPKVTSVTTLEFISFLKDKELHVSGSEMCKRAVELNADFGIADARFLIKHQDEIPNSVQNKNIIFTGTIFRDGYNYHHMVYLCFHDRWKLDWNWFDFEGKFNVDCLLIRIKRLT